MMLSVRDLRKNLWQLKPKSKESLLRMSKQRSDSRTRKRRSSLTNKSNKGSTKRLSKQDWQRR